jgi:hypothetical protein
MYKQRRLLESYSEQLRGGKTPDQISLAYDQIGPSEIEALAEEIEISLLFEPVDLPNGLVDKIKQRASNKLLASQRELSTV